MTHTEWPEGRILCGDVLDELRTLPSDSVQCCVTSPPYYGLRDYGTGTWQGGDPECDHSVSRGTTRGGPHSTITGGQDTTPHTAQYSGVCGKCGAVRVDRQLGLEPTLAEYVARLVEVFREVRRVLRLDGVCWVNMGDSYTSGDRNGHGTRCGYKQQTNRGMSGAADPPRPQTPSGLKPKDLMGVPWRLALALQDDGWWLRADIVWCLSGGTSVYARTPTGDRPTTLKDLARLAPSTVRLWNGEKWTQLLGMSKTARNSDEVEFTLRSGERIACTPTHRFPTGRGLLEAQDIRIGDCLTATTLPEPAEPLDCALDEDAAWLAGLFVAEGSRSGDTIQIAGHTKERERLARLRSIAGKFGGSLTVTEDGNNQSIRLYGKILNAILDQFVSGRTAKDKCFAPTVWQYSNAFVRSMLEGYLAGDGHWEAKNGRWRLGFTRNYNLERSLRTACARLGYHLVLRLNTVKYKGKRVPTFGGEIRTSRNGHFNERDPHEVVTIGRARCRHVYELGVADPPHLFALASGILSHNSKPNPMPESIRDRPTKAHEYIFLLTKRERYYWDQEGAKEPASSNTHLQRSQCRGAKTLHNDGAPGVRSGSDWGAEAPYRPARRNLRSVWTITPQPYREAHFATYPEELVRRCLQAGTSDHGACATCGAPYRRIVERGEVDLAVAKRCGGNAMGGYNGNGKRTDGVQAPGDVKARVLAGMVEKITKGWEPTCKCEAAEPVPCLVLDPFLGSGTTGLVAAKMGRRFVGIDLNADYCELARKRIGTWLVQHQPELQLAGVG